MPVSLLVSITRTGALLALYLLSSCLLQDSQQVLLHCLPEVSLHCVSCPCKLSLLPDFISIHVNLSPYSFPPLTVGVTALPVIVRPLPIIRRTCRKWASM